MVKHWHKLAHYTGHKIKSAWFNALPCQNDVNEDRKFDSETTEDLETNVLEDDKAEDFEILQRSDDDDEEDN